MNPLALHFTTVRHHLHCMYLKGKSQKNVVLLVLVGGVYKTWKLRSQILSPGTSNDSALFTINRNPALAFEVAPLFEVPCALWAVIRGQNLGPKCSSFVELCEYPFYLKHYFKIRNVNCHILKINFELKNILKVELIWRLWAEEEEARKSIVQMLDINAIHLQSSSSKWRW